MNDAVPRTAVNQRPHGGTDYPFARENALAGAVLDLYLSYADPACVFVQPFLLTVVGDTFTVADADGAEVAAGDVADAASTAWGDRTVYEWVLADAVLRVVVRADLLADGGGELDPRTVNRLAGRVDSLAVADDLSAGARKTGTVALVGGYNTDLALVEPTLADGGRYVRQVRIDVTPGGGLGRSPGCEELDRVVRTVNNVKPAAGGNLLLTADECFRVQLAAAVTATSPRAAAYTDPNALVIESDCGPCCTCDYMVRTYEGLRRMVATWQALADDAQGVRDLYHANRARWLAQRSCRMSKPLSLVALPLKSCYLSVAATYCNMGGKCLRPAELRLTVASAAEGLGAAFCGPAFVNGSHTKGDERYVPGEDVSVPDGVPVLVAVFPFLDPQDQAHFRARLVVTGCSAGTPLKVTATAHAPDTAGAELPTIDDGSPWGSEYPTRALEEVWVAADPSPPSFCCEGA